jgi:hypothetical protein
VQRSRKKTGGNGKTSPNPKNARTGGLADHFSLEKSSGTPPESDSQKECAGGAAHVFYIVQPSFSR